MQRLKVKVKSHGTSVKSGTYLGTGSRKLGIPRPLAVSGLASSMGSCLLLPGTPSSWHHPHTGGQAAICEMCIETVTSQSFSLGELREKEQSPERALLGGRGKGHSIRRPCHRDQNPGLAVKPLWLKGPALTLMLGNTIIAIVDIYWTTSLCKTP